jgi:hypothetical protein
MSWQAKSLLGLKHFQAASGVSMLLTDPIEIKAALLKDFGAMSDEAVASFARMFGVSLDSEDSDGTTVNSGFDGAHESDDLKSFGVTG